LGLDMFIEDMLYMLAVNVGMSSDHSGVSGLA
jgi:hypothetical protein